MMLITHKLTMDLADGWETPVVRAVQNDSNTRGMEMSLLDNKVAWEPPNGVTVLVGFKKPDGTKGLYDTLPNGDPAVTIKGSTVTVVFAPQMLTAHGDVCAVVVFQDSDLNQLASFPFTIRVKRNPAADAELSNDYFNYVNPTIQGAVDSALSAATAANNAADRAESSLKTAEDAVTAASKAKTDAQNAVTNAQKAVTSAEAAAESANQTLANLDVAMKEIRTIVDDGTDAPPIVCGASGESIVVGNSANRLFQGLRIFGKTEQFTTTGKNLFDLSSAVPKNSTYAAVEKTENTLRVYSLTSEGTYHGTSGNTILLKAGITYTLSCELTAINADVADISALTIRRVSNNVISKSVKLTSVLGKYSVSTTPAEDMEVYVSVLLTSSTTGIMGDVTLANIQLEQGTAATAWEPYTGGIPAPNPDYPQELESIGSGTVSVKKGNLIGFPYAHDSRTVNGVTFTVNDDGSVTLNGTATKEAMFYLTGTNNNQLYLPVGTYYFSGVPDGSFGSGKIQLWTNGGVGAAYAGGKKVTITTAGLYNVIIDIPAGNTLENVTFYPMINAGESPLPYEPPEAPQTLTLSAPNGLPGIPVSSGGNYTDTSGRQWICDEADFAGGRYVQRIGRILLDGSVQMSKETNSAGQNQFYKSLSSLGVSPAKGATFPILCNYFPYRRAGFGCCFVSDAGYLILRPSEAMQEMTVEELTALQTAVPTEALYVLAEPVETDLSAEELAAYTALHTNYPNTTVFNDAGAWMEASYVADTKLYVDNKFAELAAALLSNT